MTAKPTPLGGSKPLLAGSAVGLPFSVLAPSLIAIVDSAVDSSPLTITQDSWAFIYGIGGGGSGGTASGNNASGGAGGGAVFKKIRLNAGQVVTWAIGAGGLTSGGVDGNDGGDTTISVTGVLSLVAGGGKKGLFSAGTAVGGLGGIATGGDTNRNGGAGGNNNANGGSGVGGGTGGSGNASEGGGGGAAGFSDFAATLKGGNGGSEGAIGTALAPGGGSGADGGAGAAGRVWIYLVKAA